VTWGQGLQGVLNQETHGRHGKGDSHKEGHKEGGKAEMAGGLWGVLTANFANLANWRGGIGRMILGQDDFLGSREARAGKIDCFTISATVCL